VWAVFPDDSSGYIPAHTPSYRHIGVSHVRHSFYYEGIPLHAQHCFIANSYLCFSKAAKGTKGRLTSQTHTLASTTREVLPMWFFLCGRHFIRPTEATVCIVCSSVATLRKTYVCIFDAKCVNVNVSVNYSVHLILLVHHRPYFYGPIPSSRGKNGRIFWVPIAT
jgi:hypothetical protein